MLERPDLANVNHQVVKTPRSTNPWSLGGFVVDLSFESWKLDGQTIGGETQPNLLLTPTGMSNQVHTLTATVFV